MRALVCKEYGPPSQLILDDLDDPKPSKGQILIKVKAAGINFPDVLSIEGKYQVKTVPPFIPGNVFWAILDRNACRPPLRADHHVGFPDMKVQQ